MQQLFELYEIEPEDQEYFLGLEKKQIIDSVDKSEKYKYIKVYEYKFYSPGQIYYYETYNQ